MSKYDPLWKWIEANGTDSFSLAWPEINAIAGVPIDHSFLNCKKELPSYGFRAGKISMKEQTVAFQRLEQASKRDHAGSTKNSKE